MVGFIKVFLCFGMFSLKSLSKIEDFTKIHGNTLKYLQNNKIHKILDFSTSVTSGSAMGLARPGSHDGWAPQNQVFYVFFVFCMYFNVFLCMFVEMVCFTYVFLCFGMCVF